MNTQKPKPETIHDILKQIISTQDIERLITAAIIMGIQKFSQTHPKTQAIFDDMLNTLNNTKDNK